VSIARMLPTAGVPGYERLRQCQLNPKAGTMGRDGSGLAVHPMTARDAEVLAVEQDAFSTGWPRPPSSAKSHRTSSPVTSSSVRAGGWWFRWPLADGRPGTRGDSCGRADAQGQGYGRLLVYGLQLANGRAWAPRRWRCGVEQAARALYREYGFYEVGCGSDTTRTTTRTR
jgi:hypothetical protein